MSNLDRSVIRSLPIFQAMKEEDLDAILQVATVRHLAKGAFAFEQGAPAAEFFALLHGRLEVMQTTGMDSRSSCGT